MLTSRVHHSLNHRDYEPENLCQFSDSLCTEYVPFYSMFFSKFLRMGDLRYMLYFLPMDNSGSTNKTIYFETAIRNYLKPILYLKGGIEYKVAKNLIWITDATTGKNTILYALIVKKDYVYNMTTPIDYSQFLVLVNDTFVNDPQYRLMYNFVRREVISKLTTDAGMDIVQTSHVDRWCFKNSSLPLQFNTIVERTEYLKNVTKEVIDGITGS